MEHNRCYGCMEPMEGSGICPKCGYDSSQQNASHQLPAGTVLKEQYLIGKVLGQGGFGITYLGWDMYLDIPVAIKEYFPCGTVSRNASVSTEVSSYTSETGDRFNSNKKRFLREAKTLARFSDIPEIVHVKNFFLANNTAYIVMEYIKGITLKQYVRNQGGRLSVDDTILIIRPVMEVLCKVHEAGLVHRDISPDNIMMLAGGYVKLLDFGAVRDVGPDAAVDREATKSTEAILKQGYAPIEQYQSRGSLGPWTDVYALCATIYYCLTGQVPPDAPERMLGGKELDLSTMVPELTSHQENTLRKGMALRAENRFTSMNELCQTLFQDAEPQTITQTRSRTLTHPPVETGGDRTVNVSLPRDSTIQVSDVPDTTPKKRKSPRNKVGLMVAASAVLLVLIGCLVGYMLISGQDSTPSKEKDKNKDKDNSSISSDRTPAENLPDVTGQCGEDVTWTLNPNTGEMVISGTGSMKSYAILEYMGKYTTPDRPWEEYIQNIRSVTIEDGVTVVSVRAFSGCSRLEKVTLGADVKEIDGNSFEYCTALKTIQIPGKVEQIGVSAFAMCTSLQLVTLESASTEVHSEAFFGCNALRGVVRPGEYMIYFENSKGWDTPKIYAWNTSSQTAITSKYPGDVMTKISDTTYCYLLPAKSDFVLFNTINAQSGALIFPKDGNNYYNPSTGEWSVYYD